MPLDNEDTPARLPGLTPGLTAGPRYWLHAIWAAPLTVWLGLTVWHVAKPLPPGTHVRSQPVTVADADVAFIADITAGDAYGRPIMSQAIFDDTLRLISQAREFLVLDYHLFGDLHGTADPRLRPLASQLRDALINRRREVPQLTVLLITDPLNRLHGEANEFELRMLEAAGVQVVVTDLDRMRDANFLYSTLWRLGLRWWVGTTGRGWLPDPTGTGESRVTFGAWAQLLNFKANRRRVIIGDDGRGGLAGIVGSADPHEASSQHSNVALRIRGASLAPLLASEVAIARFSGWRGSLPAPSDPPPEAAATAASSMPTRDDPATEPMQVQVLTEGAIGETLRAQIAATLPGDCIDIASLYVADHDVIMALLEAARRGVNVRLILDPNKDGFGRTGTGLPNRPAASELVSSSDGHIHVRWYRTHGEQFHSRMVMIYGARRLWLLVGSADLTRHALCDYDLQADLAVTMAGSKPLALQARSYFDTLWNNRAAAGIEYTADFAVYADPAQSHYWLYRLMEGTGWASF